MTTTLNYLNASGDHIVTFGAPGNGTPLFGQTFTTPNSTDVLLSSCSFRINLAATCLFNLQIFEFNTATNLVVGSALYTSSNYTPSGSNELATFTPNLQLNSTKTYIFVFNAALAGGSGNGYIRACTGTDLSLPSEEENYDLYSNGGFYFINGTDPTAYWVGNFLNGPGDMGFSATFDVPSNPGDLPAYNPSLISAIGSPQQGLAFPKFVIGGRGGASGTTYALFKKSSSYGFNIFRTEVFHVGRPFYVKEITIPLNIPVGANQRILPILKFDDGTASSVGTEINNTNYSNSEQLITLTPDNFTSGVKGQNNFYLELQFLGTALAAVALPILIQTESEN